MIIILCYTSVTLGFDRLAVHTLNYHGHHAVHGTHVLYSTVGLVNHQENLNCKFEICVFDL